MATRQFLFVVLCNVLCSKTTSMVASKIEIPPRRNSIVHDGIFFSNFKIYNHWHPIFLHAIIVNFYTAYIFFRIFGISYLCVWKICTTHTHHVWLITVKETLSYWLQRMKTDHSCSGLRFEKFIFRPNDNLICYICNGCISS